MQAPDLNIFIDFEDKKLIIGKSVFDEPVFNYNKYELLKENDLIDKYYFLEKKYLRQCLARSHACNKAFCDIAGPAFDKRFKKAALDLWVDPYKDSPSFNRLCRNGRKRDLSPKRYKKWLEARSKILQAEADGLDNIVPWIWLFNENPSDLKKRLGKGLWKKLCARSLTFNLELSSVVFDSYDYDKNYASIINLYADKPHWLIRFECRSSFCLEPLLAVEERANYILSNGNDTESNIRNWIRDCNDTKRMCHQLNRPFNSRWSKQRIKKEHDRAAKDLALLEEQHDNMEFPDLDILEEKLKTRYPDYDLKVLRSKACYKKESREQNHCLTSYAAKAALGKYLACSLEYADKRWTIGWYIERVKTKGQDTGEIKLIPDQVRGKYNEEAPKGLCKILGFEFKTHRYPVHEDNIENEAYLDQWV